MSLTNTGDPLQVPYACAEDDLLQAGLVCSDDEPCSIYLELSSVAPAGRRLFVGGNLHGTSGTLASILISSDDGGATWTESAARISGSALEQIQFYDLEHGWAAGESQYPLPRDPFFLITGDGGRSWRKRVVTEEGGPGSIVRFAFDSALHGSLTVDAGKRAETGRYQSYESQTGGDSWSIQSLTAELPVKRGFVETPDFRVRAAGKAWAVEKRNGEKWEAIASFLVEAATCRTKALELKEPLQQ